MKKFKFIMDSGEVIHVIARSFKEACIIWENFGLDPRDILVMEQYG